MRLPTTSVRAALVASALLVPSLASAATLVEYGLNNTFAASTTPTGITASAATYNTTLNAGGFVTTAVAGTEGTHWYRINGVDLTNASLTKPSLAVASSALKHYFEFTLTPDSGYQYDLSSLNVIAIGGDTAAAYANLTAFITVEYRIGASGSFVSLGTQSTDNNDATASGTTIARDLSFVLTSTAITEATTFRVYINDQSGGGTAGNMGLDDIRVIGTVTASSVPEPSTTALLTGIGALGLVAYRRRRSV